MINEELKESILKSISLSGAATSYGCKHLVLESRKNLHHIAGNGSGKLAIYPHIAKRFVLTLSQPSKLLALNPFEIRCVLCKNVIRYPCWYYNIRYSINHFHYFVCFDSSSPEKPSTKCYRRD